MNATHDDIEDTLNSNDPEGWLSIVDIALRRYMQQGEVPQEQIDRFPPVAPLQGLRAAVYLAEHVGRAHPHLVAHARQQGASWTEVGDALGITRQSAWQRYGGSQDPLEPQP